MKKLYPALVLLVAACGGGGEPAEERTMAAAPPDGRCLQLEVVVGEGFRVEGETTPLEQVGPALARALETGNRTAIVDVRCSGGVKMRSIRELHDAMAAGELYRIQYFRDPEPPVPFVLPNDDMAARLAELPQDSRCAVAIGSDGTVLLEGREFSRAAVTETLAARPGVIFVIGATDEVRYDDFVHVLGEVTAAGAQRVSIELVEG
jgi:biopolymer transport protein ExbD